MFVAAQSGSIRGDIVGNVKNHIRLIKKAAENHANLVVFPELSLTGYERDLAKTHHLKPSDVRLAPFQEMANKHSMCILVGAPFQDGDKAHIAAFLYRPAETPLVYTKHHLHGGEEEHFDPGSRELEFNLGDEKVFTAICADITHPEHAQRAAKVKSTVYAAGVLLSPGGYAEDAALLQGYAEKHGMMVVMSNFAFPTGGWETGGKSAIWDNEGKLIASGPDQGEALVIVSKSRENVTGNVIYVD